ncbi:MAG: 23S rRNA (adenine(2503)-C(2))-methyltransferase RlmN [Planctomycetota bacterium]
MQYIKDLSLEELKNWLKENDEPAYRSGQIFQWLYASAVRDFSQMTNLPAGLREKLANGFEISPLRLANKLVSFSDNTEKYLLELGDNRTVESVVMPYLPAGRQVRARCTICISTQVGCRFHCVFCASGKRGLIRNLSYGEIVEQVVLGRQEGHNITHIVFMGMGEPLDNLDNVIKAIGVFNHPQGFNIGARRMTISTCGIPAGIRKLMALHWQVELSVSLHAPTDELRSRLMPINRQYPLKTLIKELKEYISRTNRQVTFEYIMIEGLNSSDNDAVLLGRMLKGMNCKVNLIPFNPTSAVSNFRPPIASKIKRFQKALSDAGVKNTLRDSRGADIQGACGQLSLLSKV